MVMIEDSKSKAPRQQNFTVVVTPEKAGDQVKYVAQCVEFDICVQGSSINQIKDRFLKTVWGHILISLECGVEPFACLPPGCVEAPEYRSPEARFPATLPRKSMPSNLQNRWSSIPRGELTLQMA